jgi:hypothetical protein
MAMVTAAWRENEVTKAGDHIVNVHQKIRGWRVGVIEQVGDG